MEWGRGWRGGAGRAAGPDGGEKKCDLKYYDKNRAGKLNWWFLVISY
jgi:hypothetical protein